MQTHWSYVFLALTHRSDDSMIHDKVLQNTVVIPSISFIHAIVSLCHLFKFIYVQKCVIIYTLLSSTINYHYNTSSIWPKFAHNTAMIRHRSDPGPWFIINISSYHYKNSYCGDKIVGRWYHLHLGISILVRQHLYNMGQVTKVRLSCYLVLLSFHSKTR